MPVTRIRTGKARLSTSSSWASSRSARSFGSSVRKASLSSRCSRNADWYMRGLLGSVPVRSGIGLDYLVLPAAAGRQLDEAQRGEYVGTTDRDVPHADRQSRSRL